MGLPTSVLEGDGVVASGEVVVGSLHLLGGEVVNGRHVLMQERGNKEILLVSDSKGD